MNNAGQNLAGERAHIVDLLETLLHKLRDKLRGQLICYRC